MDKSELGIVTNLGDKKEPDRHSRFTSSAKEKDRITLDLTWDISHHESRSMCNKAMGVQVPGHMSRNN